MRNFKDKKRSSGRSNKFEGRQGGANMHQATCSNCGKRCEVPFKPNGAKPVYCNYCFKKEEDFGSDRFNDRGRGDRDRGRRNDEGRGSFDKQMHQATCSDCGQRCEVPFKPNGSKPIYCSHCFGGDKFESRKPSPQTPKAESYKEDFEMILDEIELLNEKLDKALKILAILRPPKRVFTVDQSELEAVAATSDNEEVTDEELKPKNAAKKKAVKKKAATKKVSTKKK